MSKALKEAIEKLGNQMYYKGGSGRHLGYLMLAFIHFPFHRKCAVNLMAWPRREK